MSTFFVEFDGGLGGGGGSGGVTSLNSLVGALTLVAGSGITITPSSPGAHDITIAASGGGGDATSLRGVDIALDAASPGAGNILTYNSLSTSWVPQSSLIDSANDPVLSWSPTAITFNKNLVSASTNFSYNDTLASMTMGVTASLGTIAATTSGSFAFGVSQGGASISTDQNGSLVHGFADQGIIEAGANAAGSSAWGTAQGADSIIYTSAFASTAFGLASAGGEISTESSGTGALAFGTASGTDSEINSSGEGALAFGYALAAGTILSQNSGCLSFGKASDAGVISTQPIGSMAFGLAAAAGTIAVTGFNANGALAHGNSAGASITASGAGSHSFGNVGATNGVLASGHGSVAGGYVTFDKDTIASGISCQAFGSGVQVDGDFASAFGMGHTNNSYLCLMLGRFGTTVGEDDNTWQPDESVMVIGGGADKDNLANLFRVRKSGVFEWQGAGASLLTPDAAEDVNSLPFSIATGAVTGTDDSIVSANISLTTGASDIDGADAGNLALTGDILLNTGDASGVFSTSGEFTVTTGTASYQSGGISLITGVATPGSDGYSGSIELRNGNPDGTGLRGFINVNTLGLKLTTPDAEPAASEDYRGMLRVVMGATLVSDAFKICIKDATDTYVWKTVTLT